MSTLSSNFSIYSAIVTVCSFSSLLFFFCLVIFCFFCFLVSTNTSCCFLFARFGSHFKFVFLIGFRDEDDLFLVELDVRDGDKDVVDVDTQDNGDGEVGVSNEKDREDEDDDEDEAEEEEEKEELSNKKESEFSCSESDMSKLISKSLDDNSVVCILRLLLLLLLLNKILSYALRTSDSSFKELAI